MFKIRKIVWCVRALQKNHLFFECQLMLWKCENLIFRCCCESEYFRKRILSACIAISPFYQCHIGFLQQQKKEKQKKRNCIQFKAENQKQPYSSTFILFICYISTFYSSLLLNAFGGICFCGLQIFLSSILSSFRVYFDVGKMAKCVH